MTVSTDLQLILSVATSALVDPPERRYISHGRPSHDCEQLTVHVVQRNAGGSVLASGTANKKAVATMTSYEVTLVRCQPTIDDEGFDPDPDALTEAALKFQDEIDKIYSALITEVTSSRLFSCRSVSWRSVASQDPQGGLAQWAITMEVAPA